MSGGLPWSSSNVPTPVEGPFAWHGESLQLDPRWQHEVLWRAVEPGAMRGGIAQDDGVQ